jgi:hypothetical protein
MWYYFIVFAFFRESHRSGNKRKRKVVERGSDRPVYPKRFINALFLHKLLSDNFRIIPSRHFPNFTLLSIWYKPIKIRPFSLKFFFQIATFFIRRALIFNRFLTRATQFTP